MQQFLSRDRTNYAYEFTGARSVGSPGMQVLFEVVDYLGGDIYTVFYITTFTYVFLMLLAYRKWESANYKIFGLLIFSEWIFFSIITLKQSYACAFAALFFAYISEMKNKKDSYIALIFAILASLFHISGLILFPIYFATCMKKMSKLKSNLIVAISLLLMFNLKNIVIIFGALLDGVLPMYSKRIISYFVEEDVTGDGALYSFVKWMPFYYITFISFLYRKKNRESNSYNKLLIISVIASLLVLFSIVSYWFNRFRGIFYMPVFVLYFMANNQTSNGNARRINDLIVYGAQATVFLRWFILNYINFGGF